jgi:CheY-like chemotaxis protein
VKQPRSRHTPNERAQGGLIVLVGEAEWQQELRALLASDGHGTRRVAQLEDALKVLADRSVQALFLPAGPMAASDLLHLKRIRESAPRTAVVVVTRKPTDPDLKRAFESGATAFLSWPASAAAVRQAVAREAPGEPSTTSGPAPVLDAIRIDNRLHAGHRYRTAVAESCRAALDGLPGPWEVTASPVGRAWFRIEVVARDGARWSMSVPVHHGPRTEELAEVVRAACLRHCGRQPDPPAEASPREEGGPAPAVREGNSR